MVIIILYILGAYTPADGKPLRVDNQLEWAGDVPLALYHRASKLIARADVLTSNRSKEDRMKEGSMEPPLWGDHKKCREGQKKTSR